MSGGRAGKGTTLAFFLLFLCLPFRAVPQSGGAPEKINFPVIERMDSRDSGFRQYIADVENNRRRLFSRQNSPQAAVESLTIYQYSPRPDEDIFSLAARCNIPYSALASLNRLGNPAMVEAGKSLLLPSCPGIFIHASLESDLEKLLGAARLAAQDTGAVELAINAAGKKSEAFYFFPGDDFTPTERAFFLNSGFRFPLQTYRVTSAFGPRQNPVTGNASMHQGLDLAAPEGTGVFAAADGIVVEIGENPVYGIYIIIRHGERWTSLYGHLQKTETSLRVSVKSGSLIGRVGSTGQSTGPHLHFELRQDGQPQNPAGRLRP
jgi:murein DD-endopeptidase MepM/ murein hydrolase activator NlpD